MIPRQLRDLVNGAARAIGRSQADVEPFAKILVDNWFDSAESLMSCRAEELAAMGIPLRFAQQLITMVGGGSKGGAGARDSGRIVGAAKHNTVPPPPAAPKGDAYPREGDRRGRGGDGGNGPWQRTLKVQPMDPAFRARGSILGQKGRNVHHIQDQHGVKVDLVGDDETRLELVFTDPPDKRSMDKAIQSAKDLLRSVYADYEKWGEEKGGRPARPRGGDREDRGKGAGRSGGRSKEFQHTIEISDYDPAFAFRGKLLGKKGSHVRDIEAQTGASVQLKGEQNADLRLEISASSEESFSQAQELCEELVARVYSEYDQWQAEGGKDGPGGDAEDAAEQGEGNGRGGEGGGRGQKRKAGGNKHIGEEFSETLDVDLPDCDPRFGLRGKLLGRGGQHVNQIQAETEARVDLRGGERGEMFKIQITAGTQESLDNAVAAAQQLLETVYLEYAAWADENSGGGGAEEPEGGRNGGKGRNRGGKSQEQGKRQKGGGKGGGRDDPAELRKILKLKEVDPGFDLRNKLKGNNCENLHHIQDATGANLWVVGEKGDPVRLEISAKSQENFDEAVRMAKDLIKTCFKDFETWKQGQNGREPPAKRARPS